ncbi:MAG: type II toxin-antitoxin system RelE/ParE family toxin [Myxococcota bacterium]
MPKREARSIRWSFRALRDLDEIATYIARDSPRAARTWIDKLRTTAERAARMPLAARVVPEIQRDDVREVFLRSYRIVYGVRDDHIFVFTVFGGGKLLSESAVAEEEPKP